jgi:hypothetical protein
MTGYLFGSLICTSVSHWSYTPRHCYSPRYEPLAFGPHVTQKPAFDLSTYADLPPARRTNLQRKRDSSTCLRWIKKDESWVGWFHSMKRTMVLPSRTVQDLLGATTWLDLHCLCEKAYWWSDMYFLWTIFRSQAPYFVEYRIMIIANLYQMLLYFQTNLSHLYRNHKFITFVFCQLWESRNMLRDS